MALLNGATWLFQIVGLGRRMGLLGLVALFFIETFQYPDDGIMTPWGILRSIYTQTTIYPVVFLGAFKVPIFKTGGFDVGCRNW